MPDVLAGNLLYLRENHKLLQSAVARKLHISPSAYCKYENGTRLPSVDMVQRIASFYGIPIDVLLKIQMQKGELEENEDFRIGNP